MAFSHGYGQIPAEQYSIEAIRNAFEGGNVVVKTTFSDSDRTLDDCLENDFKNK